MTETQTEKLLPIVAYIGTGEDGEPALKGSRCGNCCEVLIGSPQVCPKCGSRNKMTPITLGKTGRLYNFTTVHRCLPGVSVPFVFGIVDLDGGGTVKGNIVAEEHELAFDMPVRLVFEKAEQTDAQGQSYLSYHFVKA